jgi:hypothetical protein
MHILDLGKILRVLTATVKATRVGRIGSEAVGLGRDRLMRPPKRVRRWGKLEMGSSKWPGIRSLAE